MINNKILLCFAFPLLFLNEVNSRTWLQLINHPNNNICQIDIEPNYTNRYSCRHNNHNIGRISPNNQALNAINHLQMALMLTVPNAQEKIANMNIGYDNFVARINNCIGVLQGNGNLVNLNDHCVCYLIVYNALN